MTDKGHMHTGDLKTDSPGILRSLKAFLTPIEIQEFSEAYLTSIQSGGNIENGLTRKENASYNPRPARICEILIKETKESRLEVLLAALYSCAPNCTVTEDISKESSLCIALAITLDTLRHLHMTNLSNKDKKIEIDLAKGLIGSAEDSTSAARLCTMIKTSLKRLEKD